MSIIQIYYSFQSRLIPILVFCLLVHCTSNDTAKASETIEPFIEKEVKEEVGFKVNEVEIKKSIHIDSFTVARDSIRADRKELLFKVNGSPIVLDTTMREVKMDTLGNNEMNAILKEGIANFVFSSYKNKKAYLSKDRKSALLIDKYKVKVIHSDRGVTYEGDASQFYIYDDTSSRFLPFNNGLGFIRSAEGYISFYMIENGKLVKKDEMNLDYYVTLSHDNKKMFAEFYDKEEKVNLVKIFDTDTRDLILEKSVVSPSLFSYLTESPEGSFFVAFSYKKVFIFNDKFEFLKEIHKEENMTYKKVKFLELDGRRKIAFGDENRVIIYDLTNDKIDKIEAPEGFFISDVCFNSDTTILFGARKYSEGELNVDSRIIKSLMVEAPLNDYSKMKNYVLDKGVYSFEKIEDDVFVRIMRNTDKGFLNDLARIVN